MLETVCEIFREGYRRNWITARDGNASVRNRNLDHFYITPSGVRKQTLQPEMFKRIRIAGEVWGAEPYTEISANLKPSGEIYLHFALQKQVNTEIRVVLHMHPTYTVAAMMAGIQLADLVREFPELGRYTRVGCNVPDVPPISQTLADATVPMIGVNPDGSLDNHIVGIEKHGVVAIDTSPWRAFEHIERLEHIAKIVLASKKFG